MSGIKDLLSKFEKKSTESDSPKHGEQAVQQKAAAGSHVKKAQAPSHAEKDISKRPGQVASRRALPAIPPKASPPPKQNPPLPASTTPVKATRDKAAIDALYQEAKKEFIAHNQTKAELLCTEAAEAGHLEAALFLSSMYSKSDRYWGEAQKAFHFAQIAADSGDPRGLERLAQFYKDGIGVAPDYAKARDYYNQAVAAGGGSVEQIVLDELDCDGLGNSQKAQHFEHLAEKKLSKGSIDADSYLIKAKEFYAAAIGVPGAKEKAADLAFRIGEFYEKQISGFGLRHISSLKYFQEAFKGDSPLAKAKFREIERLLEEDYASGKSGERKVTQYPLVNVIEKKAATFDDAILLLYGQYAGVYFEEKGAFLKAAQCYFMVDQANYYKMIAQLHSEKEKIPQSTEESVQKLVSFHPMQKFVTSQSLVATRFNIFLNQLARLSPASYSQTEIDRIKDEINIGNCNGFTLYYAMLALSTDVGKVRDNTEQYAELMTQICYWQGALFEVPQGFSYNKFHAGDKQGLTDEQMKRLAFTDKVKTLIQFIRYGQQNYSEIDVMNRDSMNAESLTLDPTNIKMLLGDEFESKIHITRHAVDIIKALDDSILLMALTLTESNLAMLAFSTASDAHMVSITLREGKYFYFDSNDRGDEEGYDPRYSAIACNSLDEVVDFIVKKYKVSENLQGYFDLQVIERNDVKG